MWFKKKKMVDVRELQKRGILKIPKKIETTLANKDGFVDMSGTGVARKKEGSLSFYSNKSNFSTETEGYNKREVDEKIIELDNKIYKLEQRVELLERKVGVNVSNTPDTSVLKW